jgi:OOP family OmpA-OmpF porin
MLRLLLISLVMISSQAAHAEEELPWLIAPEAGDIDVPATAPVNAEVNASIIETIVFNEQSSDINNNDERLKNILSFLQEKDENRIQIDAYAESVSQHKSKARQLSLKRAVAIRRALMQKGIAAERIVVRALGDTTDANKNRSDILAI